MPAVFAQIPVAATDARQNARTLERRRFPESIEVRLSRVILARLRVEALTPGQRGCPRFRADIRLGRRRERVFEGNVHHAAIMAGRSFGRVGLARGLGEGFARVAEITRALAAVYGIVGVVLAMVRGRSVLRGLELSRQRLRAPKALVVLAAVDQLARGFAESTERIRRDALTGKTLFPSRWGGRLEGTAGHSWALNRHSLRPCS